MNFACFMLLLVAVSAEPLVKSSLGTLKGKYEKISDIDVETFWAIPFAKPPTGKLRFALPVPFGDIGDFDGTKSPVTCPQIDMMAFNGITLTQNEDCLKLNIYRKAGTTKDSKKPVIITIHGGGYFLGSGSDTFQTAISLAAYEDVIIVSPNYRLGLLGFSDTKGLYPANLGLNDQRLAIKWVHDNIGAFGGDPNQVTLMGVSAGSMSVAAHIITPLNNERYFQSVIMDAGVVNGFVYIEDSDTSFKRTQIVAQRVNCPTDGIEMVNCLRTKDPHLLVEKSDVKDLEKGVPSFAATRDGTFIPRDLEEYLKGNNFAKVRMIVGHSRDEGSLFVYPDGPFNAPPLPELETAEKFVEYANKYIQKFNYPIDIKNEKQKQKLIERYYNKDSGTFSITAELQADSIFVCPINYFVKEFAKRHDNVYAYNFDRKVQQTYFGIFNPDMLGVFHTSGHLHFSGSALAQPDAVIPHLDKQFFIDSIKMIGKFVRSIEAPVLRGVSWPDYSQTGEVLVIDETPSVRKGLAHEDRCELFYADREAYHSEL